MTYKGQIYTPPPTSGWSWYNQQSSIATTTDNNAINLYTPKHGSANTDSVTGYIRTAPSTPYTIIGNVTYNSVDLNMSTGLALVPSLGWTDGTGVYHLNPRLNVSGNSEGLFLTLWANSTTATLNDFGDSSGKYPWATTQWFMIRNSGSAAISLYLSNDNQNNGSSWVKVHSATLGAFTPSSVGIFWNGRGNMDMNCTINSWQVLPY